MSEQELPPFQERLKAFVVTELTGLLLAVSSQKAEREISAAMEKAELEAAVAEEQAREARSNYGQWA